MRPTAIERQHPVRLRVLSTWMPTTGAPRKPTSPARQPTSSRPAKRAEAQTPARRSQLLKTMLPTRRANTERSQSRTAPARQHVRATGTQSTESRQPAKATASPTPTHAMQSGPRELPYRRPPLTRAQNRRAQPASSPQAPPPEESEQSSSGDEEPQRFGVTAATNRRRDRLATELTSFAKREGTLTAAVLRAWGLRYSVGTRHSYLVTVVAELKRRGTTISGDVPGVVREAKLELMAHPPKQAKPLTSDEVQRILSRCQDLEMYAVTELMWKTASRLTSITQLMTQDVKETDSNTISMTFRRGKTILASGPYTLWARVSNETLRYIRSQREHGLEQLFQRTAQQLYAPMHRLLQGYQVRSFRRGAVQQMASTDVTLEELRLVTRHVSDQSLYRYLNFGEESLSERRKMLAMTDKL